MSTQPPLTPKGPRNPRRQQKKNTTPYSQTKSALLTTPPSSPPRTLSPGGKAADSSNNNANGGTSKKKNNGRSAKKPRDVSKASPAPNGANGHRYTSSQPNIASPSQTKDSPHYAGPTFHASPAPSALPIPSFFSKSVPDSDLAPGLELDSGSPEINPATESTPSKPKGRAIFSDEGRESSPLDFLFKAAVEARESKYKRDSETQNGIGSPPYTDSKAYLAHRKPDGSAGGIFPLELEGSEPQMMPIGPAFATPYKDRMNALRSASSPSQPTTDLDEHQRKAKTEALKNLLLNPRPQRPASASPSLRDQPNVFNSRPSPNTKHHAVPLRTSSGPPTPVSSGIQRPQNQQTASYDPRNGVHHQYMSPLSDVHKFHTPSSALRQEISASGPVSSAELPAGSPHVTRISSIQASFHDHRAAPPGYESPVAQRAALPRDVPGGFSSPSSKELDIKRMEDDLRRILKLDIAGGIHSNGVQSSLA
ncbi:hypothetical protein VTN00DRAFT_1005 [Thermoascus crustaceus]|uniref:uncharacterized protein n=1 Tax=Thermoascus crustaceus TaxID=5088 RepID=UPI003743B40A